MNSISINVFLSETWKMVLCSCENCPLYNEKAERGTHTTLLCYKLYTVICVARIVERLKLSEMHLHSDINAG